MDIKEEFISTLSHEIRTPLTSIKGFSQTMLNSWDKLDDDKKKQFLEIILSQSQRLINLVENVLNSAKISTQNNDIVLVKINAQSVLNNCINLVKINYPDFNFNFKKPEHELFLLADLNKTQQILINILDNSAKYSLNSNNIDIKIQAKDDYVVFLIKNYGAYIEKDNIAHIFEKFYRTSSYLTQTTQGSGLGLYIADNLVKKMQGFIEVNSKKTPPETEFLIYLPIYEVEKLTKCIKQKS